MRAKKSNLRKLKISGLLFWLLIFSSATAVFGAILSFIDHSDSALLLMCTIVLGILSLLTIFLVILTIHRFSFNEYYLKNIESTNTALNRLMANVPGGVFSFAYDKDFSLLDFNSKFVSSTGYSREEMAFLFGDKLAPLIFENELNNVKEQLESQLLQGKNIELNLKIRKKDGRAVWLYTKGFLSEDFGEKLFYCLALDITEQKKTEAELAEAKREVISIIDEIPGGIAKIAFSEEFKIVYANEGFYELVGYSREDFEKSLNNNAKSIIFPEDLSNIEKIAEEFNNEVSVRLEFRIRKKNSSVIWILLSANIIHGENGNITLLCVLTDNSTAKAAQEQILQEKERYKIISNLSNDIIFEYDDTTKNIEFSEKYTHFFGKNIGHRLDLIVHSDILHEKDLETMKVFYRNFLSGKSTVSAEIRIKDGEDHFSWYQIQGKALTDSSGKPNKMIGKLVNIDEFKNKTEKLIDQSQRDPLTGLYNKIVTQDLIKEYLKIADTSNYHSIILMDVDDFKIVNDTMGHAHGDEVLKNVAGIIKSPFRSTDIVGRIGGDEFMILLKDIPSPKFAAEKAETLLELLRNYKLAKCSKSYTVSMGVIVFRTNGVTFEDLYIKADSAMYEAKDKGKNKYLFYVL